jgi:hypothetical protein
MFVYNVKIKFAFDNFVRMLDNFGKPSTRAVNIKNKLKRTRNVVNKSEEYSQRREAMLGRTDGALERVR